MSLFLQPVPASCAARKHGRAHPSELSSDQCPDLCCGSRPYAEAFLFPSCLPCWAFAGQQRTWGKDEMGWFPAMHSTEKSIEQSRFFIAPTLPSFRTSSLYEPAFWLGVWEDGPTVQYRGYVRRRNASADHLSCRQWSQSHRHPPKNQGVDSRAAWPQDSAPDKCLRFRHLVPTACVQYRAWSRPPFFATNRHFSSSVPLQNW